LRFFGKEPTQEIVDMVVKEMVEKEEHKHKWKIEWKNRKGNKWTTKFMRKIAGKDMVIEVWLCTDRSCDHFDIDVYRDAEVDKKDIVDDIDKAIISARQTLRKEKQKHYDIGRLMDDIKQRWNNKIGEGFIPHTSFCINCGVESHE